MDANKNSLEEIFAKMSEEDLLAIKESWIRESSLAKFLPDPDKQHNNEEPQLKIPKIGSSDSNLILEKVNKLSFGHYQIRRRSDDSVN